MKRLLLVLFLFLIFSQAKSQNPPKTVWTAAYEQEVYKQIDDAIKPRLQDDKKRKDLISFMVKRLKELLPGGLESVPPDSLSSISIKIGKEYGYAHGDGFSEGVKPALVPWSADIEQTIREAFLRGFAKEEMEKAKKVCDCLIIQLKKVYPDSLMMPLPRDVMDKVADICRDK